MADYELAARVLARALDEEIDIRDLAALSFNLRCRTADALVWLAEVIGPFQY